MFHGATRCNTLFHSEPGCRPTNIGSPSTWTTKSFPSLMPWQTDTMFHSHGSEGKPFLNFFLATGTNNFHCLYE
jgi:hypothetical protein